MAANERNGVGECVHRLLLAGKVSCEYPCLNPRDIFEIRTSVKL